APARMSVRVPRPRRPGPVRPSVSAGRRSCAGIGHVGVGRGGGLGALGAQPQGAARIGADDLDQHVAVHGAVATARNASELPAEPAAYAVVFVIGQIGGERFVEMADFGGGHQTPLVFAFGKDALLVVVVEFIFDIADDLLEHVFHGDQARNAAVLVNDDGQVIVA